MARFQFRLQSVLNVKSQQEEHLKNELGKAIQRLEIERRKLAELEGALDELTCEFNEKARKTTVQKLIEYNDYLSYLQNKIKQKKEDVNNEEKNVDKIREELLRAVKERKILEKFKEKKREEYLLEQKKLEQKTNDEIVSYNHKKSGMGE